MNFDPANLTSTPQGYATPDQTKQMYEYSKYLTGGGATSSQFPVVTKWTQGVSNMVNALMGGWLSNRANSLSRGTKQFDANPNNVANVPGGAPSAPLTPPPGQPLVPTMPPYLMNTPFTPTQ